MKQGILGIVLLLVVAGASVYKLSWEQSTPSTSNNSDGFTITMRLDDYQPQDLTVQKGDTVTFVNKSGEWRWPASNLHPTHDVYPEFDPKEPVANDASWSFRFDNTGEWRYHDHLAPYIVGTIKVVE